MASAGPMPSGGRRKSLDAEINLVPFIDLLSMCICFLLMTAVWMEVGSVNVKQLVGTDGPANNANTFEVDVKYVDTNKFEVNLTSSGSSSGAAKKQAGKFVVEGATNEERVQHLREVLKGFVPLLNLNAQGDVKAQMGQIISAARVTTHAGVSYGDVVTVMDTLRDQGIVNLGLVPVRN